MTKKIITLMLALAFCLTAPVNAANIIWVSDQYDDNADGAPDDQGWVDLLVAQGYDVDYTMGAAMGEGYWRTLDDDKIAALNAADLVIVSRNSDSGSYDDGDEPTQWNSITTPIILSSTHIVRSSRWKWVDSTTIVNLAPVMELADGTAVVAIDEAVGSSSFIDAAVGNGVVLATGDGLPWIFEFEAGVEFYDGAGQTAGGPRMFFTAGSQEVTDADPIIGRGEMNLTPEGLALFLDAVAKYAPLPPVITSVVRSGGVSGDRDPVGPYDGSTAPLATEAGGLKDGNMVFSDRTYPWAGIPAEFTGTEYIRTFNSDKNGGTVDVTYEVTTSQYAIVWITIDDRIPADWDAGGAIASPQDAADYVTAASFPAGTFVDSGIDIYVREAADGSNDRSMSVYAAELPAGTYVFTSMDSGKNFYTIGAVAAEAPVFVPAFVPGDIAISTQAGWFSQGAADREMQEIVDNVTAVSVEQFTADDHVCLVGWVFTHIGDGVTDLLILNGQFPDLLYPGGNAQPDGSLAEEFLDDGNIIINTGDYLFYVNSAGANNDTGGLENMMDIATDMWGDNTSVPMTAEGHAVAPSLQDFQTDRPFHLDQLTGDWEPELILAQNAAGTLADPVIVVNTVTGGRLGIFYQTASQDDDPRGEVISEWINNWYLTGGAIPNSTAYRPVPKDGATTVGIDTDLSWVAGIGAVSHDVYFGTEIPPAFVGNEGLSSFYPGTLEYGTTYYWQVDEIGQDGTVLPGALNSFTTTTPVGLFEYTQDIGGPAGIGRTTYEGYVWKNDILSEQYLLMGGGADIWDSSDQFHFAYNKVSGDVRISAGFEWVVKSNDWAKYGVMLRANNTGSSANYTCLSRNNEDRAALQWRESQGAGSGSQYVLSADMGVDRPLRVGIQRVTIEGLTWIEGLADWGNGLEPVGKPKMALNLPDELLVGVGVTSHDDSHLAQVRATDVTYDLNPSLVGDLGLATVPASADLGAPTSDVSGFSIRSLKPLVSDGWGYDAMNELLDTGTWMGLPAQPGTEGTRIDEFVNLRDTGNGVFSEANGYPDASFPGIDPLEIPAQDPAAGDDDDNFATEILGCIQLTAGLHFIGASSDDGTIIEIGGVEVGRTEEWKGASNEDFLYQVEADGYYTLRARTMEGGGGASIELHEIFMDGTRILLNDVANGGSAVFAPAQ